MDNIYIKRRKYQGENNMELYFLSNNKNVKGIEELKNETFKKYLEILPNKFDEYEIIDKIFENTTYQDGSYMKQFVYKVKVTNKPGFYILKGVVLDQKKYPKFEKEVKIKLIIYP